MISLSAGAARRLHGGLARDGLEIRESTGIEVACFVAMTAPALPPILIVLHQETSSPGRVGHALRQRGYPLDIRRPRFGDALPETMAGHAGAIIFGGPMSANDTDDFIRREIDWLAVPLRERKPYLGICLGAQMLAHHLGSRCSGTPTATPRSATIDPADRVRAGGLRPGRSRSTSGIAKASICRSARSCWRRAIPFRCRRSVSAGRPVPCNFIRT